MKHWTTANTNATGAGPASDCGARSNGAMLLRVPGERAQMVVQHHIFASIFDQISGCMRPKCDRHGKSSALEASYKWAVVPIHGTKCHVVSRLHVLVGVFEHEGSDGRVNLLFTVCDVPRSQ